VGSLYTDLRPLLQQQRGAAATVRRLRRAPRIRRARGGGMTRRGGRGSAPALGPTPAGHLSSQREPVPASQPASPPVELPGDVLLLVVAAARLRGWEVARLVCVCRAWRAALTHEAGALWRAALTRDFAPGAPDADAAAEVRRLLLMPPRMLSSWSQERASLASALRSCERRLRRDAARVAHAAADVAAAPPRAWASVRVVERPARKNLLGGSERADANFSVTPHHVVAAHACLTERWRTVSKPYALRWLAPDAPARRDALAVRPRRLHLPVELRCGAGACADYRLYTAFASALLRGRCRACNCVTEDVHAALRVPLCATAACAGAYRVAAAAAAGAAAAAAVRTAPWRPQQRRRRAAAAQREQQQQQ
jgi:hypothetical protein